jgi:hypothetical protein
LRDFPGGDIIFPAMPWARDDFIGKHSLTERPATMEASVVNGVEFAPYVCKRNGGAVELEFADGSRRDFVRFRGTYEGHFRCAPWVSGFSEF